MMSQYGSPATYQGEYYDSQTEAAWARYFDEAGMPYIHEPSTFRFKVEMYTPDFFLPDQDTYVEVKNGIVTINEIEKVIQLARGVGSNVLLLNGMPQNMNVHYFSPCSKRKVDSLFDLRKVPEAHADLTFYRASDLTGAPLNESNHLAVRISELIIASKTGWTRGTSAELLRAHELKKKRLHANIIWLPKDI